ncbi:MAG TPA: hypothetical protein VLC53_17645 [Myxococcota bacterium]|jgi:hypothetical protein|nr:hypothetical protein [Myxococcota bacterium]
MRLEYTFNLADVPVPRFSIEAVEGIGKLFTLATLIVNVLAVRSRVEIVFHGLNPEDPTRKIDAFREILASCEGGAGVRFKAGQGGRVRGSSSYYQWLSVEAGE